MADTVEELVKRLLDYADNDDHERLASRDGHDEIPDEF